MPVTRRKKENVVAYSTLAPSRKRILPGVVIVIVGFTNSAHFMDKLMTLSSPDPIAWFKRTLLISFPTYRRLHSPRKQNSLLQCSLLLALGWLARVAIFGGIGESNELGNLKRVFGKPFHMRYSEILYSNAIICSFPIRSTTSGILLRRWVFLP